MKIAYMKQRAESAENLWGYRY